MAHETQSESQPAPGKEELAPMPLGPMEPNPRVSVILGNYNYEQFVGEAIESVLGQTYSDLELIVVDDGSTDRSLEVIDRYARLDPRLTVVRKENGGQASGWNAGFAASTGQIICTLDSDDRFHPDKLRQIVDNFIAHPHSGFAIHPMMVVDAHGKAMQRIPFLTRFETGFIAQQLVRRGGRWRYMPASALCLRREVAEKIFPIPEPIFKRSADSFVFTLSPMLTNVSVVDEVLTDYRVHGSNGMSSFELDGKKAARVLNSMQRMLTGVNGRLEEFGLKVRLDAMRNRDYLQAQFMAALFDGTGRLALFRQYGRLAITLLRDDLYGMAQKSLGLFVYGTAVFLPARARLWWLSQTLGFSRMKLAAQKFVGAIKSFLRRNPRHSMPEPHPAG